MTHSTECDTSGRPFVCLVSSSVLSFVSQHAHSDPSNEIIGHLGGRFNPAANTVEVLLSLAGKRVIHEICKDSVEGDAVDHARAISRIQDEGLVYVGWYHSHPKINPFPSMKDLHMQGEMQLQVPHAVGLICSPFMFSKSSSSSEDECCTTYWNVFRVGPAMQALAVPFRVFDILATPPILVRETDRLFQAILNETEECYRTIRAFGRVCSSKDEAEDLSSSAKALASQGKYVEFLTSFIERSKVQRHSALLQASRFLRLQRLNAKQQFQSLLARFSQEFEIDSDALLQTVLHKCSSPDDAFPGCLSCNMSIIKPKPADDDVNPSFSVHTISPDLKSEEETADAAWEVDNHQEIRDAKRKRTNPPPIKPESKRAKIDREFTMLPLITDDVESHRSYFEGLIMGDVTYQVGDVVALKPSARRAHNPYIGAIKSVFVEHGSEPMIAVNWFYRRTEMDSKGPGSRDELARHELLYADEDDPAARIDNPAGCILFKCRVVSVEAFYAMLPDVYASTSAAAEDALNVFYCEKIYFPTEQNEIEVSPERLKSYFTFG